MNQSSNITFHPGDVRKDFPALNQDVYGKPLIYLDNAASSQKPECVISTLSEYYRSRHANVHRGAHYLSAKATEQFENARDNMQQFIHARKREEVIFTSGATQGINIIAASFSKKYVHAGDEVLISAMEHHSNIVPWQMACEERGASLKVIPVNDAGELMSEQLPALLNEKTRLLAITHISNTLGTINPVKQIIETAHSNGVPVLLDGAQAVPHLAVDVQELDCDFYVFSGHKMYGPTGIGVLYGKEKYLEEIPPAYGGGEMISSVRFEKTTYNVLPYKFEAGTPNIAGAIGLSEAVDYMASLGIENIQSYEQELLKKARSALASVEGLRFIGTASEQAAVISFLLDEIHPYDTGTLLDKMGLAVRTGHHCTEPLMQRFNIPGTVRASFAFYNTFDEINALADGVRKVRKIFIK
ncbi:MAG: aminotransferase class V-fold PLP-dependent enzyme [Flavobacteriales bacterium]